MAALGQPMCVEAWTATEIEDSARSSVEKRLVKPGHLLINDLKTAAGPVVFLGKVDIQYTAAESRVVPREPPICCKGRHGWTVSEGLNLHAATLVLFVLRVRAVIRLCEGRSAPCGIGFRPGLFSAERGNEG